MAAYRHRQVGTLTRIAVGAGMLLVAVLFVALPAARPVSGVALALLGLALLLFHSLTVEVDDEAVVASFGPGWIRRRIPLEDVARARAVRNPWYFGWGIRWTPFGWMFNVSGLGAVQVDRKDGGGFRIGTDEPETLAAAIEAARRASAAPPGLKEP